MNNSRSIKVAIAGLGNCASSLIEGIHYYRENPDSEAGLLFPILCGYSVCDIEVAVAFDISSRKVGKLIKEAIYQSPNNFVRIPNIQVDGSAPVFRGPSLHNELRSKNCIVRSNSHYWEMISRVRLVPRFCIALYYISSNRAELL